MTGQGNEMKQDINFFDKGEIIFDPKQSAGRRGQKIRAPQFLNLYPEP